MSGSTKEIASGAVREIEPELRELFTKVVERDPREEMLLGSFNGAFTGVTGGIAMFVFATEHDLQQFFVAFARQR